MASNSSRLKELRVLHGILKELKLGKQIGTPAHKYLMDQYKANQTTPAKFCRDPKAASYDAATYFCYLRSSREHRELLKKYGSGESSIRKSAERVGLQLPEEYKEPVDNEEPQKD